jgi:hypothetical protein
LYGDRVCRSSFKVGEVQVTAYLWFRANAFAGVAFTFDPRQFSTIEGAFKERYGEPTGTKEEPSKTRAGLDFVNVLHEWQGMKVYISLRKYAGKITESRAIIQTAAEREEAVKRFQQGQKRARRTCRAPTRREGPAGGNLLRASSLPYLARPGHRCGACG